MLGHEVKSTQIYTHGCDPDLAAGPCRDPSGGAAGTGEIASSKADDADAETLFSALEAEAEKEEKE